MSRCTAPSKGHRTASGRASCPACSSSYSTYGSRSYSPNPYSSSPASSTKSNNRSGNSSRPRWSNSNSSVSYTSAQVLSLTPIRETVEKKAEVMPDLRDVFLCHAWDDRQGVAKELHDLLVDAGVKVWFSEKDLGLGVPMMRAIDKGLANSRIGIVLVTPALLKRLPNEGVADKELSALLAGNQLIPIVHDTSYEALRNVSPLLASRSGLDTNQDSLTIVAIKISELVSV
ncbi:TIR domain protein [Pantoea sp. ICBG 985]|uniref:toll/interleukin-1 receptor domain-containing protein n=1 Tax=Pantoea sp. ICBG 985 TaxID=2071683 RepID=UPI000CE35C2A|nr:TIR domain protein [Pantoea sp. ICBG 985]